MLHSSYWPLNPVEFYFLLCNKNIRFDFEDELKIGDVRYKPLT